MLTAGVASRYDTSLPTRTLDAEDLEQYESMTDSLIEDGFINFEGDPGLRLYKTAL